MNALLKDISREIKQSFGRFFAIFAIVLIGVAFFSGVTAASGDMKHSADLYFDRQNLYDIRVLSNRGLTGQDIEQMKELEGVKGIYPGYAMDFLAMVDNSYAVFKVMSFPMDNAEEDNPDYINRLRLKEGRLPEKSGECVVKYETIRGGSLKLGDKLTFSTGTDVLAEGILEETEYTIVGFVYTPAYLSYELGNSDIGNGRVSFCAIIPEEDFKLPVYTECYLTVKGAEAYNSYTDEAYIRTVEKVKDEIEALEEENKEDGGLGPGEWYVLDRESNYPYKAYENSANQMADIAIIFPVFFFFVAALVCLTTMTRMVDEQRGMIGTYKALGYGKASIASKYVLYAFTASVLGGAAGCLIGDWVFPLVIYNSWNIVYQLPAISYDTHGMLNLAAIVSMTCITTLAAVAACYKELMAQPSTLMRPRTPKMGKKILLERIGFIWKRFSFILKVTARNIFRYKKRFLMTLIGIAGCTALLLAGFGIKNSIQGLIRKQFYEILRYEVILDLEENLLPEEINDFSRELESEEDIEKSLFALVKQGSIKNNESRTAEGSVFIFPEDTPIEDFVWLRKISGKVSCDWDSSGIVLTQKAADDLGLEPGDTAFLEIGGESRSVTVTDIAEMYVGHYIFMRESYYRQLFDTSQEPLKKNTVLATLKDSDRESEDRLGTKLMDNDKVKNVTFSSRNIERFDDMIQSLGLVTLVLIISAGALAFVVLYNLANVNISERIREIATIKVLGFYDKEVSAYVYRENVAITVMGSLCGLGLGVVLHRFIMKTIEMEDVIFGHEIFIQSYFYAFLITLLFSVFVNLVMFRKLKSIPMVESLKSVE